MQVVGAGTIRVDFGTESPGWLEMTSPDCNDAGLTMSVGEYNQPWYYGLNRVKTAAPKRYGNTWRLELNPQLYEGVRFGFINVTSASPEWHITGFKVVSQTKAVNYVGAFHSPQYPMLEKVWYTAAYTVKTNLEESYIGAILMDRGDRIAWIGDDHVAQAALLAAFQASDIVRDSINGTRDNSNSIESYALYWVLSVCDYYMAVGDTTLVLDLVSNIEKKLDHAIDVYGKNPNLRFYGWDDRLGAGFENASSPDLDAQKAYSMLTIRTLSEAGQMLKKVQPSEQGQHYVDQAQTLLTHERDNPAWLPGLGLHSAADIVSSGLTNATENDYLFARLFNDSTTICSFSPFNSYWIVQALGMMGKTDYAAAFVELCWGGMVELGATTFWEVYSPEWNDVIGVHDPIPNSNNGWTSLCHPWSSGAAAWLSKHVLGIMPIQPGFKTFMAKPRLLQVSGSMPTPYGTVIVNIDAPQGKHTISVPSGTLCETFLPLLPESEPERVLISLDGMEPTQTSDYVMLSEHDIRYVKMMLSEGHHTVQIKTTRNTPAYSFKPPAPYGPPVYPVIVRDRDTQTQGNWVGKYGRDGYVLFGWNGSMQSKLPPYVHEIRTGDRSKMSSWELVNASDPRALESPEGAHGNRQIGSVFAAPTFPVDIVLSESPRKYVITLYFCDYDMKNRRQVVQAFDFATRNPIAPIQLVDKFTQGVYVSLEYTLSIRLRLEHVRGDNAVLSAIFFDSVHEPVEPLEVDGSS